MRLARQFAGTRNDALQLSGKSGIAFPAIILALHMCCFLALFSGQAHAVKAAPQPVVVLQPDGSEVTIYLKGDEYLHWNEDEAGFAVVKSADGLVVGVCPRGDGQARADELHGRPRRSSSPSASRSPTSPGCARRFSRGLMLQKDDGEKRAEGAFGRHDAEPRRSRELLGSRDHALDGGVSTACSITIGYTIRRSRGIGEGLLQRDFLRDILRAIDRSGRRDARERIRLLRGQRRQRKRSQAAPDGSAGPGGARSPRLQFRHDGRQRRRLGRRAHDYPCRRRRGILRKRSELHLVASVADDQHGDLRRREHAHVPHGAGPAGAGMPTRPRGESRGSALSATRRDTSSGCPICTITDTTAKGRGISA